MGRQSAADVAPSRRKRIAGVAPMTALILAPFTADCVAELNRVMPVVHESWTDTRRLYDPCELAARLNADAASVLVVEPDFVFEETLAQTPALRLIGVCRASVGHIDVDAATARGIAVVNAPARNANAVAEHALALMLALARRIPQAHRYAQSGSWQNPAAPYLQFVGAELCGKTLGIIGLGAIGGRLAKICAALDMRVQAHDPYASNPPADVHLAPLDALMASSDFVSVHLPLTPETDAMLDARLLRLMKPGAYIVSASDAAVFAPDALVDALKSRQIAGAALDVFETHPISPQNPLLALDNVVLTPHIGGATAETVRRHSHMITDDILRFARGEMPQNLVNHEVWEHRE